MYPIKFDNIYFEKIWGGRDFESFRSNLPEGKIGESWDVACHKNGTSIVSNGAFKGMTLRELIDVSGSKLLGSKIDGEWFPLLVKMINARESLSVQVHPDDEYGMRVEGEMGKTEVWYVVDSFEGGNLVVGTKEGCTKEEFEAAIKSGEFEPCMNRIDVKKGDVFFVKSGLMHAIGEGVIIAEIQQNSDTTYRVFDYNRGRELHVDKALDVVNFDLIGSRTTGLKLHKEGYTKTYLCLCKDFSLELYDIEKVVAEKSCLERFYIFTCVDGEGKISYGEDMNKYEELQKGDSILIPAEMGRYELRGKMSLLKSYVPCIDDVKDEIVNNIMG